jgi:TPR repeat protein
MRTTLLALAITLPWLITPPLAQADFESGCAAFAQGDYAAARDDWTPLAAEGHAQAQFRLGCLYTFGQGVPEDLGMALRLYRLAAEQGDTDAQNNLGGMYAEGLGIAADPVEAYMWLELAAAGGHATARRNRAFLAETLSEAQIDAARERAREWQSAH